MRPIYNSLTQNVHGCFLLVWRFARRAKLPSKPRRYPYLPTLTRSSSPFQVGGLEASKSAETRLVTAAPLRKRPWRDCQPAHPKPSEAQAWVFLTVYWSERVFAGRFDVVKKGGNSRASFPFCFVLFGGRGAPECDIFCCMVKMNDFLLATLLIAAFSSRVCMIIVQLVPLPPWDFSGLVRV